MGPPRLSGDRRSAASLVARSVSPGATPRTARRRDRCRLLGTGADEAFVLLVSCVGVFSLALARLRRTTRRRRNCFLKHNI